MKTTLPFDQLRYDIKDDLSKLAHTVVRNELLCEHFLETLGVSRDEIGAKAREIDAQLNEHTEWHRRFPVLFG